MSSTRKRSAATPTKAESANKVELLVDQILAEAGLSTSTQTRASWCLREGLLHVASVDDQSLLPIMQHSGAPTVYDSLQHCRHDNSDDDDDDAVANMKNPKTCFQSLCRIVAGQQLAGAAAQTVWTRLLDATSPELTPARVLEVAKSDKLQKPAGLSGAKARSIVAISEAFTAAEITDELLQTAPEEEVREALLNIKGIGPWSCDMFLLFYLERRDVLPLGDLGVRKGLAKHFQLRGSLKQGALCQKKDADKMMEAAQAYAPYRSLLSFYMWKAADSKNVYGQDDDKKKKTSAPRQVTPDKPSKKARA